MNIRQHKFADRYLLNGNNAAEAYRFAYNPEATDRKSANLGSRILKFKCVKVYIEQRQEEYRALAERQQRMDAEELIKMLSEYLRDERDDVDYTIVTETDGPMGPSTSTRTKRVSKQWAADLLTRIIGADKTSTGNQNNIIIEEVD